MNLHDAVEATKTHVRDLRVVGLLMDRDVAVFEDRETGERRYVSAKTRHLHGDRVAYELAPIVVEGAPSDGDDVDDYRE